jgi:hypothetical protein
MDIQFFDLHQLNSSGIEKKFNAGFGAFFIEMLFVWIIVMVFRASKKDIGLREVGFFAFIIIISLCFPNTEYAYQASFLWLIFPLCIVSMLFKHRNLVLPVLMISLLCVNIAFTLVYRSTPPTKESIQQLKYEQESVSEFEN